MVRVSPIKVVRDKSPPVTEHAISFHTSLQGTYGYDSYLKETGELPTAGMCFFGDQIEVSSQEKQNGSQVVVFQNSMKIVYVVGKCLGLISVTGIFGKDVTKLRFSFLTWNYLYSLLIILPQLILTAICFYSLMSNRVSISTIIFACFYASTSVTCINFFRVSTKWPNLITKLLNSKTDEYSDPKVVKKCLVISVVYLFVFVVNHMLRVIDRISTIKDCYPNSTDVLKFYCHITYGWLFDLNFPYNNYVAVCLVVLNITAALIWSYSDLFITCISLYLSSIIKQVNKKIKVSGNKNVSVAYWKSLREDYNRITDIVRSFDDVINSVVFSSFANNLFFVCFHVYYLLSVTNSFLNTIMFYLQSPKYLSQTLRNGVSMSIRLVGSSCPNYPSGPMHGYEHSVYYISSLLFIILRLLSVAMFAAEINTVSLTAAPYLYNVPSTVFCSEVERFINQIQGDIVALSGLKFFYVTREFVLSVVGTIITYELVLLQLNSD